MLKIVLLLYATLLFMLHSSSNETQSVITVPQQNTTVGSSQNTVSVSPPNTSIPQQEGRIYELELNRWQIHNDNSHATETTDGINNALQWAHEQGYTVFKVPAGTYLIAKGSNGTDDPHGRINMVSDMTFLLDDRAVIQKESNNFQDYSTLLVSVGVKNVIIRGGTYRGDRDTHDYSSGGTHESGYGILFQGAINSTIDGVRAVNFTGDGLCVGGGGGFMQDVYAAGFESGGLNDNGEPIADASKVRTKVRYELTHPSFDWTHSLIIDNGQKLSHGYDIFFYRADGTFLSTLKQQIQGQYVQIPEGAKTARVAFNGQITEGQYVEIWNRVQSTNIIVQNSESAFNRRQGLTINGGKNILIQNNSFHDIGGKDGTAPMAGIDVEGGAGDNGFINENVRINSNKFFNNNRYDVIFYDGHDGYLENNHLASKGAIGLAVSDPFTGTIVKGNHFDGTNIYASHDVTFIDNSMNDAMTGFEGPRIQINGMTFTDSLLSISSSTAYGVTGSDIQINITKNTVESGLTIWKNPVHLTDVTIQGAPALRAVTGGAVDGNIFDNLKVIGYNSTYGLDLPPGTYNNCVFESPKEQTGGGPSINNAGTYLFNGCSFKGAGLEAGNALLDLTVRNSTFNITKNMYAISISAAKKVEITDNTIVASEVNRENPADIIQLSYNALKDKPNEILQVAVKGNSITTNVETAGIATFNAGVGAGPFLIENNILNMARLKLKANDIANMNVER